MKLVVRVEIPAELGETFAGEVYDVLCDHPEFSHGMSKIDEAGSRVISVAYGDDPLTSEDIERMAAAQAASGLDWTNRCNEPAQGDASLSCGLLSGHDGPCQCHAAWLSDVYGGEHWCSLPHGHVGLHRCVHPDCPSEGTLIRDADGLPANVVALNAPREGT